MYGMTLHIATDAFAHSTFAGGSWIDHLSADTRKKPNRYTCAKAVASKVLAHCDAGTQGSLNDFIIIGYLGNFKLCKVSAFAEQVNQTTYNNNKSYFDNMNKY